MGLLLAVVVCPVGALARSPTVEGRFRDPKLPVLVVAHRACHTPAPRAGMTGANSENSLAEIKRCVDVGGDAAEVLEAAILDGADRSWSHPMVLILFGLAVALLAAFIVIERCVARPMLDLSLFRYRQFVGVQVLRRARLWLRRAS